MDCGVFPIAFAVHAALGENVGEIEFQQEEMRSHLSKCLWKKTFSPFPKLGKGGIGIITSPVGFWNYTVTALCQRHMATWLNVNIVLIGVDYDNSEKFLCCLCNHS